MYMACWPSRPGLEQPKLETLDDETLLAELGVGVAGEDDISRAQARQFA